MAAVLQNTERLTKAYETAEGSAGSAQREQAKYTESLQYSLDQLTAHGEEFWNTFINKDDVKEFIDLINTLISGATKLVDTLGSIPTVAGILGGFAAIKNVGRPKMFGLKILFRIADNYECSFGYESFLVVSSEIHYGKCSITPE